MRLPDVNVLVGAHREESTSHAALRSWLEHALRGPEPLAMSEQVLASFVRVVTHPRIYRTPTPLATAVKFATSVRAAPAVVLVRPSVRHWTTFEALLEQAEARGNLVQDAWLAALAIDAGCEWVTLDRDFARFPGLRWIHPLR